MLLRHPDGLLRREGQRDPGQARGPKGRLPGARRARQVLPRLVELQLESQANVRRERALQGLRRARDEQLQLEDARALLLDDPLQVTDREMALDHRPERGELHQRVLHVGNRNTQDEISLSRLPRSRGLLDRGDVATVGTHDTHRLVGAIRQALEILDANGHPGFVVLVAIGIRRRQPKIEWSLRQVLAEDRRSLCGATGGAVLRPCLQRPA